MNEKPILFSTEMVQAILDGRKTQTRRVIKPQPSGVDHVLGWVTKGLPKAKLNRFCLMHNIGTDKFPIIDVILHPYGRPMGIDGYAGDLLWVKETWGTDGVGENGDLDFVSPKMLPDDAPIHYKASISKDNLWRVAKWRPSIYMPKKYTRLWLRVLNVRVERLQDISDQDVIAEGLKIDKSNNGVTIYEGHLQPEFSMLWDSINKKRGYGWEVNPWVWVIEFERMSDGYKNY